jgi:hypothetical protein
MDKQYNKIVIFLNTNLKSMKVFWFVLASKQNMRKTWMMGYLDLGEIWSFCMFCCWPWEGRDHVPNLFCIFISFSGTNFGGKISSTTKYLIGGGGEEGVGDP